LNAGGTDRLSLCREGFLWCSWDNSVVIFDIENGSTHLLRHPASTVLKQFEAADCVHVRHIFDTCQRAGSADEKQLGEVIAMLVDLGILYHS